MKSIHFIFRAVVLSLLAAGAVAQAQIIGTVTNKTTGKAAAGDSVALVDAQAGMSEVATATTDARGRYSLAQPGHGNYLVRVTHQGVTYFLAAQEANAPSDIAVYDAAAKVSGVAIEEDVIAIVETGNGRLRVVERYSVHNASQPPRTQWSMRSFGITTPTEAVISDAEAQRPGGLPTTLKLDPNGPKGHYSFNFPVQPDAGDKGTIFQIDYELPYSVRFTFHPLVSIPAKTVWVMLPLSMNFASGAGPAFQSAPQDPGFQTFVAKNALPGRALEFTVSGSGSLPRGNDSQQADSGQGTGGSSAQPGSGPATSVSPVTPDPLGKSKGWILGALALLLAVSAAILLRKPVPDEALEANAEAVQPAPAANGDLLLHELKEELFALESEKVAGAITEEQYAKQKAAMEIVLKRALEKR
jgi:hypothetical protein